MQRNTSGWSLGIGPVYTEKKKIIQENSPKPTQQCCQDIKKKSKTSKQTKKKQYIRTAQNMAGKRETSKSPHEPEYIIPGETKEGEKCICNRPKVTVMCKKCNARLISRASRVCSKHPHIAYLLDQRCCWNCRASLENLVELTEKEEREEDMAKKPMRKTTYTKRQE